MLPSELLMHRYNGEEIVPKWLELDKANLASAQEIIQVFCTCLNKPRHVLDTELQLLEGEETDYRVKRGLAHLLASGFAEFETVSPLEPEELRERVFALAARETPDEAVETAIHSEVADALSRELETHVEPSQVKAGLYADLAENQIMVSFESPTPDALIHRYNLSQAQGVLYRASELVLTAYRNDPGEYKQLFRYLKLFRLLAYIEGDPEHGFTITVDGPNSLFKASTRYGVDLAKFLPALLHVTRWQMTAILNPKQTYDNIPEEARYTLEPNTGLVSHYKKGKVYDSILEQALSKRWDTQQTEWRLEREVDLVPIPGSVMIPDFRLVHPDGRSYLFEIVGYWRPEYLRKKFMQVEKSGRDDLVLAVSERLNLEGAGVDVSKTRAKVIWFKGKIEPKDVLEIIA